MLDDMTSGIDGPFSNTRGVTTVYTMIPTQHPFTTSNKHIHSSQPRSKTSYPYPSIVYKRSHHQCELYPHYHGHLLYAHQNHSPTPVENHEFAMMLPFAAHGVYVLDRLVIVTWPILRDLFLNTRSCSTV